MHRAIARLARLQLIFWIGAAILVATVCADIWLVRLAQQSGDTPGWLPVPVATDRAGVH